MLQSCLCSGHCWSNDLPQCVALVSMVDGVVLIVIFLLNRLISIAKFSLMLFYFTGKNVLCTSLDFAWFTNVPTRCCLHSGGVEDKGL